MIRKAYGLVWEEWRRTRNVVCTTAALVLALSAFLYWKYGVTENANRLGFARVNTFLCQYILLGLVAYLPLSQSGKNDIQAGIPARRYTLPVGTVHLVLWPLLYRLLPSAPRTSPGLLVA